MSTRISYKALLNTAHNCTSICILRKRTHIKVKSDIYIIPLLLTSKKWPTSSKPKLIQKPQFLSTLLANFWWFAMSHKVSTWNQCSFWSPLKFETFPFVGNSEMLLEFMKPRVAKSFKINCGKVFSKLFLDKPSTNVKRTFSYKSKQTFLRDI